MPGPAQQPHPDIRGRAGGPGELRRALGLREALALGIGGTIGGGIFVLVGVAAGRAGPGMLVSFVLAFVASMLIALPYAELATRYPLAGGGYAVTRAVLGRRWGFAMGWDYWGAYVFLSGYVTLGFGGYLQRLTGLAPSTGALLLIAASTLLNLAGVRLSGRAQTAVVAVAVTALVGFAAVGLPQVRLDHLTPFLPEGWTGVTAAGLLAFLSLNGYDVIAAAAEEIDRPERNLPAAMIGTLTLVLALYLLVSVVALGVLPGSVLGASPAPVADAAAEFLGAPGRALVAGAALLTTAATGNAVLVVTSRISFAMARDGLLPRRLAAVGPGGVPGPAVLLNGILLALVAAVGSIPLASAAGGFLYVLHFVPPLVALVALYRRGEGRAAFRTPAPWLLLPLAFASCAALLVASGTTGVAVGAAWLAVGLMAATGRGWRSGQIGSCGCAGR
jgi:basic amino acid/polyamine antiporter, APA family